MKINPIVYVVLAVVILAGLFFVFKLKSQQETSNQSQTVNQPIQTPSSIPETNVKTFELVISKKKIVSGQESLKVNQGDEVTIKITSDEPEEFHVHAYDKSVDLEKDTQAELTFVANLTGRFPFELEESKTELGALEVVPKQ